jgi:Chaperone of endosialidase
MRQGLDDVLRLRLPPSPTSSLLTFLKMKKFQSTIFLLLLISHAFAQAPQQGVPPSNTNVNAQAGAAWYRGGNNGPPSGLAGDNTFGTRWNSPIYTITNGQPRMKLNGDLTGSQYSINGYTAAEGVNTSGYLLLGNATSVGSVSNVPIYSQMGAFSQLHLNGTSTGELSYRPWMQTGVTCTDGFDLSYVGLRKGNGLGTGNIITEMVIAWGNENGIGTSGPDDMVFRFMGTANTLNTTPSADNLDDNDYDGLHIARFAANTGNLGIGPHYNHLAGGQPTHRIDVDGNARLRAVPASTNPECLMLGNRMSSSNPDDIEFQRLDLPQDNTKFLDGTGAWRSLPTGGGGGSVAGAHNGASMSNIDPSLVSFGQSYSQSATNPARLLESRYVPMNDHNVYFTNNPTDPNSNTGYNKVGIGTDAQSLPGKLAVHSSNSGEGVTLSLTNTAVTTGVGSNITVNGVSTTPGVSNWGERLYVSGAPSTNQGSLYQITGGNEAVGITLDITGASSRNLGIRSSATGTASECIGVLGEAVGGAQRNYGIFGNAVVGPNSYAGFFNGDIYVNGTGTAAASFISSDQRFKQDLRPLEGSAAKLLQLSGYTYSMRTAEFKEKNFAQTEQIGLLAQEVREVFPQLVKEDEKGYLAVNYDGMVPVLLEAIKEQQQEIDALKTMMQAMSAAGQPVQGVELGNVQPVLLDQNAPNPFAELTTIAYSLPADVQRAQMRFYDAQGTLIQTVEIAHRGKGSLNVFGEQLSSGVYTYALIADGKVIATKSMVKQ